MHQAHRVAPLARLAPPPIHALAGAVAARLPVSHDNFTTRFRIRTFLRGAGERPPVNHALWMSSFSPAEQRLLFTPDALRAVGDPDDAFAAFHAAWAVTAGAPLLARAGHLDLATYLANDILMKVDRASMAVALEVRAPFLAREVVEFAFSLPDAFRMRGLTGKRILRDAARDLVPGSVLTRAKKGFGMPVARWLTGPLRPLVERMLGAERLREAGWFRPEVVDRMLREHLGGRADHRKPLWTLLVFELWREQHLPGRRAPHPTSLPTRIAA